MLRITDQYFWNFIFSLFFAVLVFMGVVILQTESRLSPSELTVIDIILMTLATFRLTRLMIYDVITKFIREQFWDVVKVKDSYILEKPRSGPRRTLVDLMNCPWCMSMWMGAFVIFFYLWTAYAYVVVLMLAISALASVFQIGANWLGHSAERAKRDTL